MPIPPPTSPRASPWEWAQATLLAANLAWSTLGRGGYPPGVMVVTAAITSALLTVHLAARALRRPPEGEGATSEAGTTHRLHPAGWWLLPFLAYAAANVAWVSPVPWLGWRDWLLWAQIVAVFWVALNGIRARAPQRVLLHTLALLGVVGVLLASYQVFVDQDWLMLGGKRNIYLRGRGSGSFGLPNSLAAFHLLLLPAVVALCIRKGATPVQRVWWGWVGAVLLFGFALTISRGAWFALAVVVLGWLLFRGRGSWRRRLMFGGAALAGIVALGAVLARVPAVGARFQQMVTDVGEKTRPILWRAAGALFRERPLTGTGAGSYNVRFEKHRPERFWDEPLWAHNDYLNTLSDYGAVGFLLLAAAGAAIAVAALRARPEPGARRRDEFDSSLVQEGLGIGLVAFALHLALEFHLKIPALGMTAATLAAILIQRRSASAPMPPPTGESTSSRIGSAVVAAGCAAAFFFFFLPQLRAESFRRAGREAIDALADGPVDQARFRAPLERSRAALARATELDPRNGQAWSDSAYATVLWSHVDASRDAELGREAERAADRALERSQVCYEFWIRRGLARDLQGRWAEAGEDFGRAVKLAPANTWAWYYYAEHLSHVRAAREAAEAAVAVCLRLDPWNRPGLALRQRLAIKPKGP